MSGGERDRQIDGLDAVRGAYRAAHPSDGIEPPAALDDAIRAAARRAVKSGPAPLGKSWLRRWTPPLAVAATVILTVSVTFVAVEDRPDLAPAPVANIAQHKQNAEAVMPVAPGGPATPSAADRREKMVRPPEAAEIKVASPPSPRTDRRPPEVPAALARERKAEPMNTADAVADAPAAPAPPAAPARAAVVAPAPPAAVSSTAPPASVPQPVRDVPMAAPATSALAKTATAHALSGNAQTAAPTAGPAGAGVIVPQESRRSLGVQEAAGARPFTDAPVPDRAEKDDEAFPDRWLDRMKTLRARGEFKALREELARFSKRYPNIALPKELKDLPPE